MSQLAGHIGPVSVTPTSDEAESLKFGIAVTNWGSFGDPRRAVELAALAEESGWDGYFTWDALLTGDDPAPNYDPWVILAAVAMATERIRIGTCVAVVPRYRPHLLAMTVATLDVLSGGRMILGVGLGDATVKKNFEAFGEASAVPVRAEKLDEALDVMTRLWTGERVTHHGIHFVVDDFALTATPVQQPRVPIWVGGDSPAALRRASRWDGWIGPDANPLNNTADDAKRVRGEIAASQASSRPIDIAWAGRSTPEDQNRIATYSSAGATWWIEILMGPGEQIQRRVALGPPSPIT